MADTRARRILIDGAMAKSGGGFTYLVNVIPHLTARSPEDRFRVLVRSERLARSIQPSPNLEIDLLPAAPWAQRLRFTYQQVPRLAKAWGADLYFSAGESAPLRAHCPMIASLRNPNVYTALDQGWPLKQRVRLRILRELSRLSARACDRIMFVSEDSASWIGDTLGIPERRRAVIHHGIDAARWARPEGEADLSNRPSYILSVSSIYRYKNFVRLIEAYAALARRREDVPELVIIGDDQDSAYSQKMQHARAATGELAERIHILGEVPYAEIQAYYAGAQLFVFPSYLETFGHPLLEAMASGIPAVAADIPVFREIGADAAFYADPHKADALASAMEEVLYVPRARDNLIKRGHERVRGFGWDATAAKLSALFDDVLADHAAAQRGRLRSARQPRAPVGAPAVMHHAAGAASTKS